MLLYELQYFVAALIEDHNQWHFLERMAMGFLKSNALTPSYHSFDRFQSQSITICLDGQESMTSKVSLLALVPRACCRQKLQAEFSLIE